MRVFVAGATVPSLVAAGHEVHGIALHHEPPQSHRPPGRQQIADTTVAAPVAGWLPELPRELGARPRHPSWRRGFAVA
jgi:hypothetical protein